MSTKDAVLVEFMSEAPLPASFTAAIKTLLQPAGSGLVCAALEEPRVTAYLRGAAHGTPIGTAVAASVPGLNADSIEVSRLSAIRIFAGASSSATPAFHYIVRTDVAPGGEQDLERWYDEEHMPALAAVPGVVLAQRLVSLDAGPRYYACYDLIAPTVLQSKEWLAVRATDWSSRVRPTFRNTRRIMCRRVLEISRP